MKLPHQSLTLAAIISLLVLAACQPIQAPSAESETSATAAPARTTTPSHTTTFDATKYQNVWVQAIEEIENDGRSLLRISYPVTEQETINARMEAVTQEFIEEYRMVAAEIEKSYQEYKSETGKEAATFITHYRQHFDVAVANENVIFFDIVRSIHTGGTGNSYVVGYIFDRRSGAELSIPDLFVDDSYLERLSTLTREVLAERVRKEELASGLEWVEDGTSPIAENFDNILFRGDGTVVVMFDKYQVAAGVEGVVEVEFPLALLADLLKPEVRDLLGIGEGNTSLGSRIATAAGPATAMAFPQAVTSTYPKLPVLRNFPELSLLKLGASELPKSSTQNEINCLEVACVALTFDDGPSFYTEGLLDTLKEHNVKATFFVLGTQVRIQSETIQRMFQEGHQIGNHTWDHPNLTQMADAQIREQLQMTDDLITQIIGVPTPFLRPPYGAYNDRVLAATGVPIIFWSVDPLDWRDRDAEVVAARIIISPVGAIILAHDIHRTTVAAVPAIIAALKGRGIHFVTVAKLFEPQTLLPENVYINQPDSPSE